MTDGGIYYSGRGEVLKKFNTKDGYGLVKLQKNGIRVGIITGRVSSIVKVRARELGISELHQNLDNKLKTYLIIRKKFRLTDAQIAYIGDDEPDLPVLEQVGFSAAPADAMQSVRASVDYVCRRSGGDGAVREVVDLLLRARG